MSEPAARLFDATTCSVHGSAGIISGPGATDVFMSGIKAARFTDLATCAAAHESPLAEGVALVLINGMPASCVGMKTLDSGEVVVGDATVLVGGAVFTLPPFVGEIEGTADFQSKVLRDLFIISGTPTGKRLFASLTASGHKVRFKLGKKDENSGNGLTRTVPSYPKDHPGPYGPDDSRAYDGTGIDSEVKYDPYRQDMGMGSGADSSTRPPNYTPEVTLVHELVHANDMAYGTINSERCANPGGNPSAVRCGERRAMGLPPYDDEEKYPFSENGYRRDRGYTQPHNY